MLKVVWLAVFILSADAYPTKEIIEDQAGVIENSDVKNFEKDLQTVSYIQNFKNMMADYVKNQYNNLTISDMEEVKTTLEEFLQNFAIDLHKIMVRGETDEVEPINDGIPDSTFEGVKKSIQIELADVNEHVADQIVYKLRKNLYKTRQKLDKVIRNSQIAEIENA